MIDNYFKDIVVDPKICHGKPTFRGTRILVADILEQIANGFSWDAIIDEWRGAISKEDIRGAILFARDTLIKVYKKYEEIVNFEGIETLTTAEMTLVEEADIEIKNGNLIPLDEVLEDIE